MVDDCISAMTPLMSEGVVYVAASPDLMDDIRHNAQVHVKRTMIVTEICLRFSPHRCGEILFEGFDVPDDLRVKFDLFYGPLARSLRSLLQQYDYTIFRPPFFVFYRVLVGMYLGFCHDDKILRTAEQLSATFCTKNVACDHCKSIGEFLLSGDESKEFVLTNMEWSHLRYVSRRLKNRIFPPTVTTMELGKTVRIKKRTPKHIDATKEFLKTIGDDEEISRLMEPLAEEIQKALNGEEVFDFERCLRLPPPPSYGSQTA